MKVQNATIKERRAVAQDTYEITLETFEEFYFSDGQYIQLTLPAIEVENDPHGNSRQFSIASSPQNTRSFKILFRKSETGYKKALLRIPIESIVTIIGPLGTPLLPKKKDQSIVFVAGGVGIAPFMGCIDEFMKMRSVMLICANTQENRMPYREELKTLQEHHYPVFQFTEETGLSVLPSIKKIKNASEKIWYIFGPKVMVVEVVEYLLNIGVPLDQLVMQEFYHLPIEKGAVSEGESLLGAHELLTFKRAAHSSYNHIIITSIDGVILYANPVAERITGFSAQEMEGRTPRLWGSLMEDGLYKNLWHTIKVQRKPFVHEMQNHKKNGELYFAKMIVSPIINEKDILLGFESTEEDITDRKRLEENLKERNEMLEKMNSYMVNREIKMIELKEEDERLRNELQQYKDIKKDANK